MNKIKEEIAEIKDRYRPNDNFHYYYITGWENFELIVLPKIFTLIQDRLDMVVEVECPRCKGEGRLHRYYEDWRCNDCTGTGKIARPATLQDIIDKKGLRV